MEIVVTLPMVFALYLMPNTYMNSFKLVGYLTVSAMAVSLVGCRDYDADFSVVESEAKAFQKSGVFDFATSGGVRLDLDFAVPGAMNPVWIYDQYPYDEEGDLLKGIDPVFACFLHDGAYNGVINLPTATREVYVAVGGIGLPTLLKAQVVNGQILLDRGTRADLGGGGVDISGYTQSGQYKGNTLSAFDGFPRLLTSDDTFVDLNGGKSLYPGTFGTAPYATFANTLYALYPWTVTGRPGVRVEPTTSGAVTGIDYSIWYNGTELQGNGFTLAEGGEWQQTNEETKTPVNQKYSIPSSHYSFSLPVDVSNWKSVVNFKKDEGDKTYCNKITLASVAAGTLRFYLYDERNDSREFLVDGTTSSFRKTSPVVRFSSELSYVDFELAEISGDGTQHVIMPNNSCKVASLVFTPNDGDPVSCWFDDEDGVVVVKQTGDDTLFALSHDDDSEMNATNTYNRITLQQTVALPQLSHCLTIDETDHEHGFRLNTAMDGKDTVIVYFYDIADFDGYEGSNEKKFQYSIDGGDAKNLISVNRADTKFIKIASNVGKTSFRPTVNESILFLNHSSAGNSFTSHILAVVYRKCTDTKTKTFEDYYCYFTNKGLLTNKPGLFSYDNVSTITIDQTQKYNITNQPASVVYNDVTYTYATAFDENTTLKVTAPIHSVDELVVVTKEETTTFVVSHGSTNKDVSVTKHVGVVKLDDAKTDAVEYTIKKKDGKDLSLYYASLKNTDDYYSAKQLTGTYMAYDNKDDDLGDPSKNLTALTARLTNTLWRKAGSKANAKSQFGIDFNREFTSADQDKNNINVVGDATKLYVNFLAEYNQTSANTFGYYYYPTNNKPQSPDELKKIIVFPNCTSSLYSSTKKYGSYNNELAPLTTGDRVQLFYYDESAQQWTGDFPDGVTVGWFLIYNGFDAWDIKNDTFASGKVRLGLANNNDGKARPDTRVYYSDPSFNSDNQARCIQLSDPTANAISLCFEDSYGNADGHSGSQDWTYDDLIIAVTANPYQNIVNNAEQEVDDDVNSYVSYREEGMYLFEDIWTSATDFDLNDVVMSYSRLYTVESGTQKITKVDERYTFVNDGASYQDAFAVKMPYLASQIDSIIVKTTVDGVASDPVKLELVDNPKPNDDNTARLEVDNDNKVILVLFDNINAVVTGTVFDVSIVFKEGLATTTVGTATNGSLNNLTSDYGRDAYNPFIIVYNYKQWVDDRGWSSAIDSDINKRCEIHKPGHDVTKYGKAVNAESENRWFVKLVNDGSTAMPFALELPVVNFVGCKEGVCITGAFNKFEEWVTSGGDNSADWYKKTPAAGTTGWRRF